MTAVRTPEQDLRLRILNTLLTTPHRDLAQVWPVHREMAASDPRFYVRLAAWYSDHGDVRDHKEMFAVTLVTSDFPGHRDVGLALLREMPPYQVARVVDFVHGRKTTKKVRGAPEAFANATRASKRARRAAAKAAAKAAVRGAAGNPGPSKAGAPVELKTVTESFGLFKNVPRSVRTEVERYLREREADAGWFDGTVLQARKAMKRLYAVLHVKPSERAQQILFEEAPPADSRVFALKQLARATSPAEQARAIVEHAIPYRVAATVVSQMTPAVLLALVERMSPQELINNVGSLKARGAFDNPDLKALIDAKLDQARSAGRVSAFKAGAALAAAGVSTETRAKLEKVADDQIKAKGRIDRPTALLVDKSGSMALAIELGKRIGAMISAVCSRELYVYAFDTMAYPIEVPRGAASGGSVTDLAAWEKALAGITAGGGTSCGAALEFMRTRKQYVEQVILVTDEEENAQPRFVDAFAKYRQAVNADPNVCIVRTPGARPHLEPALRAAGINVDVFEFAGDYYSLPNLVPLLSRPSKLELLMEIMEYPLPARRAA